MACNSPSILASQHPSLPPPTVQTKGYGACQSAVGAVLGAVCACSHVPECLFVCLSHRDLTD